MTAAQKIAMGLVITLVDSYLAGYDAVPDVLGWVLVVLGLRNLRDRLDTTTLMSLAAVAGVVSLALVRPEWTEGFPESTGWLLSLPQLAFSFVLCREVASVLEGPAPMTSADALEQTGHGLARRLRLLSGVFVVVASGPVLLYGGGVDVLLTPLAVLSVVANVSLVYLLFRASTVLHGPLVTRGRRGEGEPDSPGNPDSTSP